MTAEEKKKRFLSCVRRSWTAATDCNPRRSRTGCVPLILFDIHQTMPDIPFSILDLSPITQGATAADALHNSLDLARHAEKWGYRRYWVAEHHNFPGIASAAT